MAIVGIKNAIQRALARIRDVDHIQNVIFNESAGAQKNINVEPVIKRVYTANEAVLFGSLVKVAAGTTAYDMICTGKAHNVLFTYRRGDLVTQTSNVYIANQDIPDAHAFSVSEWTLIAPASITGIPVTGGATVCVGKYHNAISVNGFLVEDETNFRKAE